MTTASVTAAPNPTRTGRYAGPVTRLVAWVVDVFVAHVLFALITVTVIVVVAIITGRSVHLQVPAAAGGPADLVWLFLYFFVSWATVGKTVGMNLVGLLVVRRDGSKLHAGRAAVRTLVLPFSFILGLGLVGIVVGREHRALHDVAANTVVVFD
jgi:uncharacterized RDD family membrane protein YckC